MISNTSSSPDQTSSEKLSFEAALEKLQNSVKKMESGELSLEESLQLFEEGVRLTRLCQEHLQGAEQRVEAIRQSQAPSVPQS